MLAFVAVMAAAAAGFLWARATGHYDLRQACGYVLLVGVSLGLATALVSGVVELARFAAGALREPFDPQKFALFAELKAAGLLVQPREFEARTMISGWPLRVGLTLEGKPRVMILAGLPVRMKIEAGTVSELTKRLTPEAERALAQRKARSLLDRMLPHAFRLRRGRMGVTVGADPADPGTVRDVLDAAMRLVALAEALKGRHLADAVKLNVVQGAMPALRRAAIRVLDSAPFDRAEIPGGPDMDPDESVRLAWKRHVNDQLLPPESDVLRLLAAPDVDTRIEAAQALAIVGTADAIPVLRERQPSSAPIEWAAHERAIEKIKARLKGAAAGQLSLAAARGELSVAAEPGRLSPAAPVAEKPKR